MTQICNPVGYFPDTYGRLKFMAIFYNIYSTHHPIFDNHEFMEYVKIVREFYNKSEKDENGDLINQRSWWEKVDELIRQPL